MLPTWPRYKFEEVCLQITDGAHNSPKSVEYGLPMASVKDLTSFGINIDTCRLISEEDFRKLEQQNCRPHKGDVLIAKDGNSALDTVCEVKEEIKVVLLSSTAIFTPDPSKLLTSYLRYYLDSETTRQYLKRRFITGAAIPRVVLKDFKKAEISLPPLPTQRKIAAILSAYDDLIENNTRRIALLEQMAQLLYREWFVRFRFPGHESARMVESELGEIPEGWEVTPITEFCSKITDGTHDTPKPTDSGYYLVTGKHLVNGFIDFSGCYRISYEDHKKVMERSRPEKGDIIFSNIGTLGSTVLVDQDFDYSIKNVALLKPLNGLYSTFLYLWLSSPDTLRQMLQKASGTSQKFFSLEFLRNLKFFKPPIQVLQEFAAIADSVLELRSLLNRRNIILRRTRDLLLQRLISGEVDVAEMEIAG